VTLSIQIGAVFRVPLGPHVALGKVLAIDGEVVSIALADQTWTCAPGVSDYAAAGTALAHIPLHRDGLVGVEWAGVATVDDSELAGDYARWRAGAVGGREVINVPVKMLFSTLLSLNE